MEEGEPDNRTGGEWGSWGLELDDSPSSKFGPSLEVGPSGMAGVMRRWRSRPNPSIIPGGAGAGEAAAAVMV